MDISTTTPTVIQATSASVGGFIEDYLDKMYRQELEFPLVAHEGQNFAYHISEDLKPISFTDLEEVNPMEEIIVPEESQRELKYPNSFRLSMVNNPFNFERTYQVGNGRILAVASNAVALSTGQFGEYPLFVFCEDGIYAMFVGGGEVSYSSSRPVARDVCNNSDSVKPIDGGVVFTTDRGLMIISGSQVQEISIPVEGAFFDFTNPVNDSYLQLFDQAVNHASLVQLKPEMSKEDFRNYITAAIIAYNHNERELWVINPSKTYVYIYRSGIWLKIKASHTGVIEDYPLTYLYSNGILTDITSEATGNVPVMFLTRPIKLGTRNFKQAYRVILRSLIKTTAAKYAGLYIFGSYDGVKWAFLGGTEKTGTIRDLGANIERVDCKYFRIGFVGELTSDSSIEYIEISAESRIDNKLR